MRRFAAIAFLIAGCVTPAMKADRECARHSADGLSLLRRGSHREARDYFKLALAHKPEDPDLLYCLGRCEDGLGDSKQAEALYLRCLGKDSGHEGARHALVLRLVADGRLEDARKTVAAWLAHQPDKPGPYVEDGLLRLGDGDLDAARGRFQQALDFDPHHVRANTELGKVYERLGREGRALVLYQRASADPNAAEARANLERLRRKRVSPARPD